MTGLERKRHAQFGNLLRITCILVLITECISDGDIALNNINGKTKKNVYEQFTYHLRYGHDSSAKNARVMPQVKLDNQAVPQEVFKGISETNITLNQNENEEDIFEKVIAHNLELNGEMSEKSEFDSPTKIERNFCSDMTDEGMQLTAF